MEVAEFKEEMEGNQSQEMEEDMEESTDLQAGDDQQEEDKDLVNEDALLGEHGDQEEGGEAKPFKRRRKEIPEFMKSCENSTFSISNIKIVDLAKPEMQTALTYGEDMDLKFIRVDNKHLREPEKRGYGGKIGSVMIPIRIRSPGFLRSLYNVLATLRKVLPELEVKTPEDLDKVHETALEYIKEELEKTKEARQQRKRLLFVHNLSSEATEEDVKAHFKDCLRITLHEAPEGSDDIGRYAEMEFEKCEDIAQYMNKLRDLEICKTKIRLCKFPPTDMRSKVKSTNKKKKKKNKPKVEPTQKSGPSMKGRKRMSQGSGGRPFSGTGGRAFNGTGGGGRSMGLLGNNPYGRGVGNYRGGFGGNNRNFGSVGGNFGTGSGNFNNSGGNFGSGGGNFGQGYGGYGGRDSMHKTDAANELSLLKNKLAQMEEMLQLDQQQSSYSSYGGNYGGGYNQNSGSGGYSGGYNNSGSGRFGGSGGFSSGFGDNNQRKRQSQFGNQDYESPSKRFLY